MAVFDGTVFDPLVFDAVEPVTVEAQPKGLRLQHTAISTLVSSGTTVQATRSAIFVVLLEVPNG